MAVQPIEAEMRGESGKKDNQENPLLQASCGLMDNSKSDCKSTCAVWHCLRQLHTECDSYV